MHAVLATNSHRLLLLVLPILLACAKSTTTSSSAAAPAVEAPNEEGRQALGKIEDDWAKALEAHDTTFFLRVLAPDFRATGDSGKMFGRAEVVHDAADTTFHVRDLHDQDRQIRIYGNGSVGVVSGLGTWTVEGGPRPGQHRGRYTEVYVKQGEGQWQGVAGHYTVVTP